MRAGQGQQVTPGRGAGLAVGAEPQVAQQVEHDGRAVLARRGQRQAGQGAHLQVELRGVARVHRVVAAVVRARSHLVDDQRAVLQHEEFDAQHAHVVQLVCYRHGSALRLLDGDFGQVAFINLGHGQDAVAVQVALHRQADDLPVAPARHDDRTLVRQRQHLLQHAGHAAHALPGGGQFVAVGHARLALAVVAQARGFQDAGQQHGGHLAQVGLVLDHRIGRGRHAAAGGAAGEVRLLADAVLRDGDALGRGRHRTRGGQRGQRLGGHVLEFGGDGVAARGQFAQRVLVAVVGLDEVVAHAPRRAAGVGVEHHRLIAQRLRRVHEHAAQLAAAQHAQGGGAAVDQAAGQQGQGGGHLGTVKKI